MRYRFIFNGIVQGVGFRPTIYKIAISLNLRGFVLNSSDGVVVEIEGKRKDDFLDLLYKNLPPLAKIDSIKKETLPIVGYKEFKILSSKETKKTTFISPDKSICKECIEEMFDKSNRRYLYPFINCTNCGPRYTIIENIPYDRKNTSMKKFKMCNRCYQEYTNPLDRRYHAEPISCFECGPKLRVFGNGLIEFNSEIEKIKFIANKLKEGKIVALKGLGGFHLMCDGTNEEVVKELRIRKKRAKPFALMFKNLESIKKYCFLTKKEEELITSYEKPIVLVKQKKTLKFIADGIDRYGVFLPYTPLHLLLFEFIDFPLVATSANVSGEPIIKDVKELFEKLNGVFDFVLDNDRDIVNSCDDSVVEVALDKLVTIRSARGYAPFSIKTSSKKNILGVGANQKSTISIGFEGGVILSPHIGDLETIDSVEYFKNTIKTFKRLYEFEEDVIICDKHPFYESTKWALSQNKEVIKIQHHFAHALSVMFEHNLKGEFLAFIFDGTGYGDDGSIWGGEVFWVNRSSYKRLHYIKPFKLIGGEKGIKNPANLAVSLIDESLAKNYPNYKLVKSLKNAPFPLTSSMGRVFDVVAFLGGMIERNEYEGYSGLRIEKFYNEKIKEFIDLKVDKEIDFSEVFNFATRYKGEFELVSSVFINTIEDMMIKISKMYNLPVIVGGGVFQNRTLLSKVIKSLNPYFNQKIPLNDGGISVGQVAYGVWNL